MRSDSLNILLLWDNAGRTASTVAVHVSALVNNSKHAIHPLAMIGDIPASIDLDRFDAIVIHYSLVLSMDAYVSRQTKARLAASNALKAMFIQDEYRFVDKSIAAMREIGLDLLFTCVPEEEIAKVYSELALPGVRKVNVLTGYVDASLLGRPVPPYSNRSIDIGYRARKVPAWLGELGQEKWDIGRRVGQDGRRYGLKVDLAYREEERLYGDAWIEFLSNCKATLGVESGSSVFDFTGEIQRAVEATCLAEPEISFTELQERYFNDLEGKIRLNQISPRCFEAAALRTLMVLYEGEYSGRLKPWRHFLPLKKDHSNFPEIVAFIQDEKRAKEIIDWAYEEVALNPNNSFDALAKIFDKAIRDELDAHYESVQMPYSRQQFSEIQKQNVKLNRRGLRYRYLFTAVYFFLFGKVLGFTSERFRDRVQIFLSRHLRPVFRKLFRR